MFSDANFWIQVLLVAALLFGVRQILRAKWSVRIVADRQGIKTQQGLAKAQERKLLSFFQRDLQLDDKITICALRAADGRLRCKISGRVDRGTQQQIRNFLITML